MMTTAMLGSGKEADGYSLSRVWGERWGFLSGGEERAFDFFIRPNIRSPAAMAISLVRPTIHPGNFGPAIVKEIFKYAKYVMERDIANGGSVTAQDVIAITRNSCSGLNNRGPKMRWLHRYGYPGQNLLDLDRAQ